MPAPPLIKPVSEKNSKEKKKCNFTDPVASLRFSNGTRAAALIHGYLLLHVSIIREMIND